MSEYRLGFIGAGKLAGSIIRGLIRNQAYAPREIVASEPNEQVCDALRSETGIDFAGGNAELAKTAETILIGVKPAVALPVIRELDADLADKMVISLAAGVRISSMEKLAHARFMRVMTNTPAAIGQAATALARGSRTTDKDLDVARRIFDAIGVVVEIEEAQIDAVTALSGSGPAFVYTVIEALAEGGKQLGLHDDVALTLATQTVLGAAQLAAATKMSPEELRRMVVSPGGTTAAGLAVMKKLGTSESVIAAVEAAAKRGREMSEENL